MNFMNKLNKKIISIWRAPLINQYARILKGKEFAIISSNCLAGVMYHDAKSRFLSPTINLSVLNFLDFVENLQSNLLLELSASGFDKLGRPLGKINNIIIKGHHYSTCEELVQKWNERSKRALNCKNIFIVATDEFITSKEDEKRFDLLKYPKICFVNKPPKYNWQIYLPEFRNEAHVLDCMKYRSLLGKRIFEKHFNYAKWIEKYYEE